MVDATGIIASTSPPGPTHRGFYIYSLCVAPLLIFHVCVVRFLISHLCVVPFSIFYFSILCCSICGVSCLCCTLFDVSLLCCSSLLFPISALFHFFNSNFPCLRCSFFILRVVHFLFPVCCVVRSHVLFS